MALWSKCVLVAALAMAGCCSGRTTSPAPSPAADSALQPTPAPTTTPTASPAPPEDGALRDRAAFIHAMSQVKPGMTKARVRELLGEPEDMRTQRDPGGITAARTEEIWRYGTAGHLTFPTLGSVHVQADGKVQYAFGGQGEPPPPGMFDEQELRRLLRIVDQVPSYNSGSQYDPLRLIRAVNALQPLGKEKALALVAEYLRVSSWLDDPGREGVFLLLRALFEVPDPPGHMPPMMVGAPSPAAPSDPKALPRFPLLIRDDIPFLLVTGYALGGAPEPPERHLEYFREHGVVRAHPLRPIDDPLALADSLAGKPGTPFLQRTGLDSDWGRAHIMNQALLLVDSVYRTEPDIYGARFSVGAGIDKRWRDTLVAWRKLSVRWDPARGQYTFADGTSLPPRAARSYQRAIWDLPIANTTEARLVLERRNDRYVQLEVRVAVPDQKSIAPATVRVSRVEDDVELVELKLPALGTTAHSSTATWSISGGGSGVVHTKLLALPEGTKLRAELQSGSSNSRSPVLEP